MADEGSIDDTSAPPIRLMNFVSEHQLEESRKSRGSRVDDGTAQRDRSLFEILKENKDKKDAEFNERFKHRPPKALDEDETEFLDNLEMSRKEYEQQVANEEAQELQRFQAAVAAQAQSTVVSEPKEIPPVPKVQEEKLPKRKNSSPHLSGIVIKVKPQAKKARTDPTRATSSPEGTAHDSKTCDGDKVKTKVAENNIIRTELDQPHVVNSLGSLVSYSDGSDEDDE